MNPGPILATLLHLRLWAGDAQEDPAARAERLQDIAIAIGGASSSREEAAFLLTVGEAETRFASFAGYNRCRVTDNGRQCDHGKARSYWQLHHAACPGLWNLPPGDARGVYLAAQCAVQLYRYARFACTAPGGAFDLYAGQRCGGKLGEQRYVRMNQILIMLKHSGMPWPSEPK